MKTTIHIRTLAVLSLASVFGIAPAFAQAPPPLLPPGQLNTLVARIALYPDSLLAQILAAATYPNDIPDAARWSDQHHYLQGQDLANAIQADQLPWDPSVQALLPFPPVLEMMASDMNWTTQLGDAFLNQQRDVMDAVQRDRHDAQRYGYLRSNAQIVVGGGPYITIMPVNPAFVPVPYYNPAVVFYAPRPGFVVGGAIHFGFGITVGAFFRPWGWAPGYGRFDWGARTVIINNNHWNRTWVNRTTYVHPYEVRRFQGARPPERHELEQRNEHERNAWREGRPREEEHHDNGRGHDRGNGRDRDRR